MNFVRQLLRGWLGIDELADELEDLEDDFISSMQDVDDMIPGNKEKAEAFEGIYTEEEVDEVSEETRLETAIHNWNAFWNRQT